MYSISKRIRTTDIKLYLKMHGLRHITT